MTTLKDRLKQGKDARKQCSRNAQAMHGKTDRDPLPLIKASSAGRIRSLNELRFGRMLVSPFAFYRGNALLHAHDLSGTPDMGLHSTICGDCHLMNFGGFGTPERNLLFSVNDFDEVHPGPWEWDLKRLVASFLVALLTDDQERPLFLQLKEARRSVLADYVKAKSRIRHNGQRVVEGQRLMQSASDLFLGWTTSPNGQHFYVRQLRDMKISAELETFDAETFSAYGHICGKALARAHAKASGQAAQISGYIGKSDVMADALFKYAKAYSDQNKRDFERFQQACRKGKLQARSEADFAADHLP
ncbi:hypothetical protein BLL42_09735 [Pseudomonas frederiksbergensis]|uniref:DUF2252 domain-containing protein n=1 Tax=Pseudomonas frederiksbergensis TaxID=104087 RepID=A0A1J0EIN7_9PSED|nr:DUF2252 family protein [Pseudomonas frederiksbergensis]APC15997.1 hypothetical protein BLL42_09735 [Pseudomonas frederiksbergensis]